MKALGVRNRCRLFEIPKNIDYIIALPHMSLYIKYCADIFDIYLDYFSPDDIHLISKLFMLKAMESECSRTMATT